MGLDIEIPVVSAVVNAAELLMKNSEKCLSVGQHVCLLLAEKPQVILLHYKDGKSFVGCF